MANTIGLFSYSITKKGKSDPIPFDPWIVITLAYWGSLPEPDGAPTVSAHLMTEREIDDHIQNLKNDLDAVATKAKQALLRSKRLARG